MVYSKNNIKTRLLIGCIIAFNSIFTLNAQQQYIDSLRQVLNKTSDVSVKSELYEALFISYSRVDIDSAYSVSQQLLALANRSNDINLMSIAHRVLGTFHGQAGERDSAIYYLEMALGEADEVQNHQERGRILRNLGTNYFRYDNRIALQYYERALDIAKSINDSTSISANYLSLGGIYFDLADYNTSLNYYFESLEIVTLLNNGQQPKTSRVAHLLYNIANCYGALEQYDLSLKYLNQAAELSEICNDEGLRGSIYNTMSIVFMETDELEKSVEYALNAIGILEELISEPRMGPYYFTLGQAYLMNSEFDEARKQFDKAQAMGRESNDLALVAGTHINIAEYYMELKQYQKAKAELQKGKEIARSSQSKEFLRAAYFRFYELDSLMGNYQSALNYYIKHIGIRDSLESKEKLLEIGRVEAKYELEKISSENELLQKESALNSAEIRFQKTQKYWLIVVLALALVASIVIFLIYQQVRRRNKSLRSKNITIKEQNEELLMLNEEVNMQQEELMATNEELAGNINRYEDAVANKDWAIELIGQYVAGPYRKIKKNLSQLKQLRGSNDQKQLIHEIEGEINNSEAILTDLYDENSLTKDTFLLKLESTELIPIAEEVCHNQTDTLDKSLHYTFNFEVKEVTTDAILMERIFRHIIEYLSLHVERNISIGATRVDDEVHLYFKGYALGLEESLLNQDFFKNINRSKVWDVSDNKGVQLGMLLVHAICEALEFKIEVKRFDQGIMILLRISPTQEFLFFNHEEVQLITDEETERIFNLVEEIFRKDKVYLNGDLSLKSLAEQTEINPKYISYSINRRFEDNFQNYVNSFRVAEAKRLLKDPSTQHLSYMSIGFDSGFNSKSAFYSTFKKVTGLSPKDFKADSDLSDV